MLAAGVLRVEGTFAAGQAVRVCVIRGRKAGRGRREGEEEGRASAKASRPVSPDHFADRELQGERNREVRELRERVAELGVGVGEEEEEQVVEAGVEGEEILEFGRGLTNYNSAEIDRVKGLRR